MFSIFFIALFLNSNLACNGRTEPKPTPDGTRTKSLKTSLTVFDIDSLKCTPKRLKVKSKGVTWRHANNIWCIHNRNIIS